MHPVRAVEGRRGQLLIEEPARAEFSTHGSSRIEDSLLWPLPTIVRDSVAVNSSGRGLFGTVKRRSSAVQYESSECQKWTDD